MHGFRGFLVGWFALTVAGSQAFALSYAESSSGDLSNSLTAPTSLGSLNVGSNLVSGHHRQVESSRSLEGRLTFQTRTWMFGRS